MRKNMAYEECTVVGRNAVMEAYRSGKTIDKLFILDGCQDGPIKSILREARKRDTLIKFVSKEKLDSLSFHEKHQGVVAIAAAYEYATVEDLFKKAEEKDNRNSAVQRPDEQRGSYPDRCSRQLFGHSARWLAARAGCRRPVKIKKFPEKS